MFRRQESSNYRAESRLGTEKIVRISEMFELSKFELSGTKYRTLLNQVQGTWGFVRNSEMFELSGIRINGCLLYEIQNCLTEKLRHTMRETGLLSQPLY